MPDNTLSTLEQIRTKVRDNSAFWKIASEEQKSERNKENFFRHISKNVENECWNWKARLDDTGYGQVKYSCKTRKAHRVSWILHNGEIPNNLLVLHKCDNRKCVNPEHLFLGTSKDNTRDMMNKGRAYFIGQHRITWSQEEKDMILRYYENGISIERIGVKFSVSKSAIRTVLRKAGKFKKSEFKTGPRPYNFDIVAVSVLV